MTSLINKFSVTFTGVLSSLLATAVSVPLFTEWPYLKYLEVYFYDKNKSSQRVRLWIEDLGNLSKAQYFKTAEVSKTSTDSGTGTGTWEYLGAPQQEQIDYKKLINLARQFIETQHYLNVARAIYTSKNWNSTSSTNTLPVKCSDCCKDKSSCACKSCLCCYSKDSTCCNSQQTCNLDSLKQKQALFSYYLSNLNAPFQNVYLTPVQAHINLSDSDFSSDLKVTEENGSSDNSEKTMIGSLVYGFVDYSYKETVIPNNDDLKLYVSNNLNAQNSDSSSIGDNKKYFYNIPQQFSFKKIEETENQTEKKTIADIWHSFNKNVTEEIKALSSKIDDSEAVECCCCTNNSADCLVKKNFVVEASNLSDIQNKIKDSQHCCSP